MDNNNNDNRYKSKGKSIKSILGNKQENKQQKIIDYQKKNFSSLIK
jgi:hypothetical protein